MNHTLILTMLFSISFFSISVAAQKESKTSTPWTAEQFRTADEEALLKRNQELTEIFGLSESRGIPEQKEIELQKIMLKTIQEPKNIQIAQIMLSGNNKIK